MRKMPEFAAIEIGWKSFLETNKDLPPVVHSVLRTVFYSGAVYAVLSGRIGEIQRDAIGFSIGFEFESNTFDLGDVAICDMCGKDFSEKADAKGGLLFKSKAVCPECVPSIEDLAKQFNETQYIERRAQPGQSFHDFVKELRGGKNATMTIATMRGDD